MDTGNAVSAVPVLWLYARGYGERGATVRSRMLAELAGLGNRGLRTAFASIHASDLAEMLSAPRASLSSFRIPAHVLSFTRTRGFFFPGSLVSSGTWASLTPGERCVLVAIAASAHRKDWHDEGDYANEPQPFREWLERYGDVHTFRVLTSEEEELHERPSVRRLALVSDTQLANMTGMHASSVSRSVNRLVDRDGSLLAVYSTPQQRYYLLPPAMWGDTETRIENSQYPQPIRPRWVSSFCGALSDGNT